MKKKLLILLTLMFFAPFIVNAETLKMEWEKGYGGNDGDYFYSVVPMSDGGFLTVGQFRSTDIEGIFNKGVQDAIIVKYDKDGNVLWQKSWGGNSEDYFRFLELTKDGGFIMVGGSMSDDIEGITYIYNGEIIIVKYDKDGNMLWQKIWGGNDNDLIESVFLTEDDEIIIAGYSDSTDIDGITNKGYYDAIIIKYDKDGNLVWQKSWGGSSGDTIQHMFQTEDGGFIVAGEYVSTDIEGISNKGEADIIIIKYDKDGNMLWQKNYAGNASEYLVSTESVKDGGFFLVVSTSSTNIDGIINQGGGGNIIVKYDKDGNMLWQKNMGGGIFNSSISTEDGGIIGLYYTCSTDIEEEVCYTIIVKYDKDGNMLWQKRYDDIFFRSLLTADAGIIVVGDLFYDLEDLTCKGGDDVIIVKYLFEYNLENITSENGIFTVEQKGKNGIVIPTPNEGYEIEQIIVKDKEGNVLDVEVVKLQDGTYSFELIDDVTVEVLFKEIIENPKTGVSSIIGLLFTITLCFISGLFILRKYNERYEF